METNIPYSSINECGYSVWKTHERKTSQCIWGCAEAEEEFVAGEMCASLKATMGMLADNEDKSVMDTLLARECVMEASMTNIFYTLC
jgi:hypothetical protein